MKKITTILIASSILLSTLVLCISDKSNGETFDYRGKIYIIGTSISCGHTGHDPDHSFYTADNYQYQYAYWIDYYMDLFYNIQTNVSAWMSNATANSGWDKYNLATGGGTLNDVYPAGWDGYGMRLDCVPMCVNGTWGRALWRLPDWHNVDFLIVEGGHHDISKDGDDWHEMAHDIWEIYNQSKYYGYKVILLAMTPDARASTSNQWYENITRTNEWRKSFCENHSGIYYADVFHSNLTIFNADGTWQANTSLIPDGTHPNLEGYKEIGKIVAKTLFRAIQDMIPKKPRILSCCGHPCNGGNISIPADTPINLSFDWGNISDPVYYKIWIRSADGSFNYTVTINHSEFLAGDHIEYIWGSKGEPALPPGRYTIRVKCIYRVGGVA